MQVDFVRQQQQQRSYGCSYHGHVRSAIDEPCIFGGGGCDRSAVSSNDTPAAIQFYIPCIVFTTRLVVVVSQEQSAHGNDGVVVLIVGT